ncbi:response regulator [Mesorhizobium sp. M0768]|uniref:response regulator n=1 Tax=Mesorhizobium sp. M0768 TaxID=2956996 RepID=UPI00333CB07B
MEERPIILVVEVDETIQELVHDALTERGYQPAMVTSAHEAVNRLQSGQADYRARGLPDRQHEQLGSGSEGEEDRPGFAVVYMTAGTGNEWPSEGVPSSVLLQKPFALAQLVTAVS